MLEVRLLRKAFGPLVAVDGVSFAVAPGEIVGLLGPNGAGKTTTVSMVTGIVAPDSGEVLVAGARLHGDTDPKKKRIGFVPQDLAVYDELPAAANLQFFAWKTPASARGLASFAVLMMVMLGGAWVPTSVFPQWVQQVTVVVPTRWAVDGLDAMTWRGLGVSAAVAPTAVLLGFALLFATAAWLRFRWEEQ